MMVLLVGEKPLRRATDTDDLRRRGIHVEKAANGAEGQEFLRAYDYDVVVLDLALPDMPGLDFIRQVRTSGIECPILAVTASAMPEPRVSALDHGADDVLADLCPLDEILARLRAVVRRRSGYAQSVLRCGAVELHLDRHEVLAAGRKLPLTPKEYVLVELLFLKAGRAVSKASCLNHLYCGMEEREAKTIDVIVFRIRKKLVAAGIPASVVQNVWGCGYRLAPQTDLRESQPAIATAV